jgi:hypothetical protein
MPKITVNLLFFVAGRHLVDDWVLPTGYQKYPQVILVKF